MADIMDNLVFATSESQLCGNRHPRRPECVGQRRRVNCANTQGFYIKKGMMNHD